MKIEDKINSISNMNPGDLKGSPDESYFFQDTIFSTSNELIKTVYKYVLLTKEDFEDSGDTHIPSEIKK